MKIPINIEIRGLFVSLSNRRCFLLLNVLRLVLNVNEYEDGIWKLENYFSILNIYMQ